MQLDFQSYVDRVELAIKGFTIYDLYVVYKIVGVRNAYKYLWYELDMNTLQSFIRIADENYSFQV